MSGSRAAAPRPVRIADVTGRLGERGLLVAPAAGDALLLGVTADSRDVLQGDLFCAWSGTTSDSHNYVPAAAAAGAAAAVVERTVSRARLPQIVVNDGRRAAAIAASFVLGDPQQALRIVGVTGTNGKTTTVWITRHLLGHRYRAASIGTLGTIVEDGSVLPDTDALTTPGPVELASTLRALVDRGAEALAMETSSHALHQGRVAALRFDAAVFTNLSRDHLDYHGTLEQYLEAKLLLCERIAEGGCAVVNAGDPAWSGVAGRVDRVISFGTAVDADVRAEDVALDADGARFTLTHAGERAPVTLPLPGDFNVQNALGAAAAGIALGFTVVEVAERLATVPQVPGRLERIAAAPCTVLRDYAHTPDALERALAALRPLTAGRLIVVFGAGGDRDRGKRPLMGAVAEAGADVVIVTSDNPRTENPAEIIDQIVVGMEHPDPIRIVDRRAAIAHALSMAGPDDIVLLAGKGHETYQVLGLEKRPFDEREIVRELLSGMVNG